MDTNNLELMIHRTAWMIALGTRAGSKNLTELPPDQRIKFAESTIEDLKFLTFQELEDVFEAYLENQSLPPHLLSVTVWLSAFTVPGHHPYRANRILDLILDRIGYLEDTELHQENIPHSHLLWLETLIEGFLRISDELPRSFATRLRRVYRDCQAMLEKV